MHIFYQLILLIICLVSHISLAEKELDSSLLKADKVYYDAEESTFKAEKNVEIYVGEYLLEAEKLQYNIKSGTITASDGVKITDKLGRIIHGERVVLKDKLRQGVIDQFTAILKHDMVFAAKRAERLSKDEFVLEKSIFTPCKIYCNAPALWQIKSSQTNINQSDQMVTYKNALFEVYGVPIAYIPYLKYPMPDSDSKSGLLIPTVKKSGLSVPIYLSLQSNMDLTLTPRIAKNYVIFGTQFRHKTLYGDYELNASFGNPQDEKLKKTSSFPSEATQINKNRRFHLFPKGNFIFDKYSWGFDLNVASDKSYLTNYHDIYDPYLTSVLYGNYVMQRNYVSVEALGFQELRDENRVNISFVSPLINTHHTFELNKDSSLLFNTDSNSFIYIDEDNLSIGKSSWNFELAYNHLFHNGQVIDYHISHRLDMYSLLSNTKNANKKYPSYIHNTPEFGVKWRCPLIKSYNNASIIVEPTINLILDKQFGDHQNTDDVIDLDQSEPSENNLFNNKQLNIFKTYDGFNLSYGLNGSLHFNDVYISSFFGQTYNQNLPNHKQNFDYIGNLSIDWGNNFLFLYRFHTDQRLKPIRHEFDLLSDYKKLKTKLSLASLNDNNQYKNNNFGEEYNKSRLTQMSLSADYNILKDLWVGGSFRLNIHKNQTDILTRTIHMTYLFDCVKLRFKMSDHFLQDKKRGVEKTRHLNFSIGLKSLNL